jgi:hypothetical protein
MVQYLLLGADQYTYVTENRSAVVSLHDMDDMEKYSSTHS